MTAASENIREYLEQNGPAEKSDLPHDVATRVKMDLPNLRRIQIHTGSKRTVVWYLDDHHDEMDVIESFLESHPEFMERFGPHGAAGRLRSMGRSWGQAAKELIDIPHGGGPSKRTSAQEMIEEGLIPPPAHQEASQ